MFIWEPRLFSILSILCWRAVPGVGGTFWGILMDNASKRKCRGRGRDEYNYWAVFSQVLTRPWETSSTSVSPSKSRLSLDESDFCFRAYLLRFLILFFSKRTTKLALFLGGLHVTNPPIRFMCPTSVCPSTFSFPDSYSKTLCPIEFKLGREIDHHHS